MAVIGFSTGAIAFHDFENALRLLEPTSANAVELSALRAAELPGLMAALPRLLGALRQRYQYVSFHAPTDFGAERTLVEQLKPVAKIDMNIIVHPDTIQDVAMWRQLGSRLCLENMDSRKMDGRTAEELRSFFSELPEARLCFDIAHAREVDPTMIEARRIVDEFKDRIAQIHLSEIDDKGKHFAMSIAAKRAYEPFAMVMSQVPVILESVVGNDEIVPEIIKAREIVAAG